MKINVPMINNQLAKIGLPKMKFPTLEQYVQSLGFKETEFRTYDCEPRLFAEGLGYVDQYIDGILIRFDRAADHVAITIWMDKKGEWQTIEGKWTEESLSTYEPIDAIRKHYLLCEA